MKAQRPLELAPQSPMNRQLKEIGVPIQKEVGLVGIRKSVKHTLSNSPVWSLDTQKW